MAFLGWSKGVNGWAQEWVEDNVPDPGCDVNRALADIQSDIAMKSESCAAWVKQKRFGANRTNALAACNQYINEKYDCQLNKAQEDNYERDKKVEDQLASSQSPLLYVGVFVVVALVFYLLMF